ncbi:MAG: hypothetical protein KBA04_04265, partial [Thiopseudomonas sp.]|nr:hypothetical protein [Thiopseudomonas sp.]
SCSLPAVVFLAMIDILHNKLILTLFRVYLTASGSISAYAILKQINPPFERVYLLQLSWLTAMEWCS